MLPCNEAETITQRWRQCKPLEGNIAQELEFLAGGKKKKQTNKEKTRPILRPSNYAIRQRHDYDKRLMKVSQIFFLIKQTLERFEELLVYDHASLGSL